MAVSLPIGDFSRATHMSIKTLRYYHRVGLLEPADVDRFTGHRRYATDQIPAAQVIRRFRDLDMPIEDIRGVLATPDVAARNELITAHLSRLEENLARTHRPQRRDPTGPALSPCPLPIWPARNALTWPPSSLAAIDGLTRAAQEAWTPAASPSCGAGTLQP